VCISTTTDKAGDIRWRTRTVVTEGTAKLTQQYTLYILPSGQSSQRLSDW